jgi:Ni,Fe-hydrogenase III large subunit
MTAVDQVTALDWRTAISAGIASGGRFAGAWASRNDHRHVWRALLVAPTWSRVLWCEVPAGVVDTIVDLIEAAGWDEREAHDLYGLRFAGHSPLRALVTHTDDPRAWMTPVSGEGVHQVAVGPIHAGVIESGHFRFHVVGERILAIDPRLFYKHRGLERDAEGATPQTALAHAQRACAACAVTNTVAYAQAVEEALGLWPDRDLRAARTLLLELERLYNHLHDISAICAGVGFAPGSMAFAALKDRAQTVNATVNGHRFLFGAVAVGRGVVSIDEASADRIRREIRELRNDAAGAWHDLQFAGSVQARLGGVGVLSDQDALRLGAVGPAARASGIHEDMRCASPRLAYAGFKAAAVADPAGDVAARLQIRAVELEATCEVIEDLLGRPIGAGHSTPSGELSALGVGQVEGPRGRTICAVELDAGRVTRVHLRTGSYANWPALAHASEGNLLPDFPLINKSFELCYACVDR